MVGRRGEDGIFLGRVQPRSEESRARPLLRRQSVSTVPGCQLHEGARSLEDGFGEGPPRHWGAAERLRLFNKEARDDDHR